MTLDEKIIDACGRVRDRDDAIEVCRLAVAAERKRCATIVLAARMGEIDQDFRSVHHRIKSGDPFPSTEPE